MSLRPFTISLSALLAIFLAVLLLALASRAAVPVEPVPITLQSLAVVLVGGILGWRLGTLAVLSWLVAAAAGLPMLADGAGGLTPFSGPTAGYLFAFPFAAALVGILVSRGWGRRFSRALAAMLLAHGVCLLMGAAWLAVSIGPADALRHGVLPFLPGGLAKSLVGALVLRSWVR